MGLHPQALPDFPWDTLAPLRAQAAAHPDGLVDLSVGTPVDPTPASIQDALRAAADSPGYPTTHGTLELREAVAAWFERRRSAPGVDPAAVLPTVGSKEFVALLPGLLGLGAGDTVVLPAVAYPTYDAGARLAGAKVLAADDVAAWEDDPTVRLVWVNSPSNPTGAVFAASHMRRIVEAARNLGAVVASDECYAQLAWSEPFASEGVPSILDPRVCGDSHEGVLAVYSLSKQSNLAGYRAAFAAGDPALVASLLETRKHMGLMMPGPVQRAMAVAIADDSSVEEQKAIYGKRRVVLSAALAAAGFRIDASDAGLYLWSTRNEDCWDTMTWLAERGIVAAPGAFYGAAGSSHVRIALTANDSAVEQAARRLVNAR